MSFVRKIIWGETPLPCADFAAFKFFFSAMTEADLIRQSPDLGLLCESDVEIPASGSNLSPVAYCSLWWKTVPQAVSLVGSEALKDLNLEEQRIGIIGHFAAKDAQSGSILLQQAMSELKAQKCTLVIGPLDGNTWNNYRLVTERGNNVPFFLEPWHPDFYLECFKNVGFEPLSDYFSTEITKLDEVDPRIPKFEQRATSVGMLVRNIDLKRFEAEINDLYDFCSESFADNYLYQAITRDKFIDQYQKVLPVLDPQYFLMAFHGEKLVGFVFAIPDLLQKKAGIAVDSLIVKTLAVKEGKKFAGLGSYLCYLVNQLAYKNGYVRVIHALMHHSNLSLNVSRKLNGRMMRRYSLFIKRL